MRKINLFLLITLSSLTVAFAQQQKGDFQLQAQGSYFSASGFSGGTLFVNGSKFITQNVEVGAAPIIAFGGETTINLSLYSNYNFITNDAKMVPYAGAQLLLFNLGAESGSEAGFGLKGGLRYFITERVNVDVGPSITFLSGGSLFYFNAGLGFILGRKE
jgi:hypothetical protein